MEKTRHPNLIQFVGAVTQHIPMMIVSEYPHRVSLSSNDVIQVHFKDIYLFYLIYCQGDLASYLKRKGRLKANKVLRFALDIARYLLFDRN